MNSDNQRRKTRHSLTITVDVVDESTKTVVGKLANIHEAGMMLVGQSSVVTDRIYRFQLLLPSPLKGQHFLSIQADCLWERHDQGSTTCWSGYQIVEPPREAVRQIQALIAEWSGSLH